MAAHHKDSAGKALHIQETATTNAAGAEAEGRARAAGAERWNNYGHTGGQQQYQQQWQPRPNFTNRRQILPPPNEYDSRPWINRRKTFNFQFQPRPPFNRPFYNNNPFKDGSSNCRERTRERRVQREETYRSEKERSESNKNLNEHRERQRSYDRTAGESKDQTNLKSKEKANEQSRDKANDSQRNPKTASPISQRVPSPETATTSRRQSPKRCKEKPSEKPAIDTPTVERTNPKIQVRPLVHLLRQEILAVTQEERLAKKAESEPEQSAAKKSFKPAAEIRQRTVSSSSNSGAELSINERLATMDKEGLKYIINNSDTIYDEHLKLQARRRLREAIRLQLKSIELEQPKDTNTVSELIEDEIVDAIKLPAVLLQEIEKFFLIDISGELEESETQAEALENTEVEMESDMTKECRSSTDLMSRLKVAEEFKAMAKKRSSEPKRRSPNSPAAKRRKILPQMEAKSPKPARKESEQCSPSKAKTSSDSQSPTQSISTPENSSPEKQLKDVDKSVVSPIKAEIKQELPTSTTDVIVLSSSEDEGESGDEASVNAASDASNSSSASAERRYKQKLKSDAENVVDSFEKLILPHLGGQLEERYRSKHSNSLQTRLHFISCVCTSEYNSQNFSKIEIANIQKNLKADNNRLGIEFLLREIVNVVNTLKQTARCRQQDEQQPANELTNGAKTAEQAVELPSKSDAENADNATPTSGGAVSVTALALHHRPMPYLGVESTLPRTSPGSYSLDGSEQLWQLGLNDSVTHNHLFEIDRRLLDNQNRRSFLEEMINKFQKEKSDLELLSLELQSRKFLLLNTTITRSQATTTPTTSPPPLPSLSPAKPAVIAQSPAPGPCKAKKPRVRRAVVVKRVKILPKRKPAQKQRAPRKPMLSKEQATDLVAELQREIRQSLEEPKKSAATHIEMPLPMRHNVAIKAEPAEALEAPAPPKETVKPRRVVKAKAKAATASQQQPLAIIPPLPPPPPPPEQIAHMTFDLPRILLKSPPVEAKTSPSDIKPSTAAQISNINYGFIPSGRLHNITSPITQIRIYKVYIIAAAEDGDVYMFNIANHKLERQITKHSEAITNMFLSEQDALLYTTSLDGFLKKSSLENLERVLQTVYFKEPLQSIDIAWNIAYIGSRWGNIFTYNVMSNKVIDTPLLSTGQSIIAVKATKEGVRKIIMLGCKGNFIHIHDAASGLLLRRLGVPDGLNVYSLLLDGGQVYCGTQKNELYKFDFPSGSLDCTLSCGNGAVSMATYGERYLLVGCYDGYIYVLDKIKCTQVGRFEGSGRLVLALAIAGDKVVTSSKDNSLEILEIPPAMLDNEQPAVD